MEGVVSNTERNSVTNHRQPASDKSRIEMEKSNMTTQGFNPMVVEAEVGGAGAGAVSSGSDGSGSARVGTMPALRLQNGVSLIGGLLGQGGAIPIPAPHHPQIAALAAANPFLAQQLMMGAGSNSFPFVYNNLQNKGANQGQKTEPGEDGVGGAKKPSSSNPPKMTPSHMIFQEINKNRSQALLSSSSNAVTSEQPLSQQAPVQTEESSIPPQPTLALTPLGLIPIIPKTGKAGTGEGGGTTHSQGSVSSSSILQSQQIKQQDVIHEKLVQAQRQIQGFQHLNGSTSSSLNLAGSAGLDSSSYPFPPSTEARPCSEPKHCVISSEPGMEPKTEGNTTNITTTNTCTPTSTSVPMELDTEKEMLQKVPSTAESNRVGGELLGSREMRTESKMTDESASSNKEVSNQPELKRLEEIQHNLQLLQQQGRQEDFLLQLQHLQQQSQNKQQQQQSQGQQQQQQQSQSQQQQLYQHIQMIAFTQQQILQRQLQMKEWALAAAYLNQHQQQQNQQSQQSQKNQQDQNQHQQNNQQQHLQQIHLLQNLHNLAPFQGMHHMQAFPHMPAQTHQMGGLHPGFQPLLHFQLQQLQLQQLQQSIVASASNQSSMPVGVPAPGCIPLVGGSGYGGVGTRQGGGGGEQQQHHQQQHQQHQLQQQHQHQLQLQQQQQSSLIGDELRAVLGLSASAIRGVKVNKQQAVEETVSNRRAMENILDGGVPAGHHLDSFAGLGGTRGGGHNSSRLVTCANTGDVLMKDLDVKAAMSALASSSSSSMAAGSGATQNPIGRRVSRRTASRGVSRSSGKMQASNLLSIIESEQALKNIQGSVSRGGGASARLRTKSEDGGGIILLEGDGTDLSNHSVSGLVENGSSSGNNVGSGRFGGRTQASSQVISPSELNRIENLHFSVETVPHLVKDYVPAFSGKFAFLPQPPLDSSSGGGSSFTGGYDFSENHSTGGGAGTGSQSHQYGGGQQEGGNISHGLRSRKARNNNSGGGGGSNCRVISGGTGRETSMTKPEMHLSRLLPNILTSICGGKGLKMVAKEKLSFWMDLPCNMDRKKAKTGLGPSTRESLRKELKKQGELFRLVSTKDEFLCDSKMIKGADVSKLYLDFQRSQSLNAATKTAINPGTEDPSSSTTVSTGTTSSTASTTATSSPSLPPLSFPPILVVHPTTDDGNNNVSASNKGINSYLPSPVVVSSSSVQEHFMAAKVEEDLKGKLTHQFSPSDTGFPGISISSSTIETNSPTRRSTLTQSSIENSDHSGNRMENSNSSNNSANSISENSLVIKSSSSLHQLNGGEIALKPPSILPQSHGTTIVSPSSLEVGYDEKRG